MIAVLDVSAAVRIVVNPGEALQLSTQLEAADLVLLARCPAYDMFYLVLARRHGATLLTADETLRRTAHSLGVRTGETE